MHLKTLKVFCDIVAQRSFSRAADENSISQSGASQLVHQLERRLSVKLIDRSKRPFVLTPEGETYYEGCRGIVQKYFALEEQVRSMHREVDGSVRVASIYSVGLHHMDLYLKQFLTDYPNCNVRLEYLHPERVYESIDRDTADLGLVSYPRNSRSVEVIPWRREPMVVVCAPEHAFAERESIQFADLDGQPFIGFDDGMTIRREIDRALEAHDVAIEVRMAFDNIETIKRAVEINAGVSILPLPTVTRELESGSLHTVELLGSQLVRPLALIHRHGRELSVTAHRFIDLLVKQGQEEVPPGGNGQTADPSAADGAAAARTATAAGAQVGAAAAQENAEAAAQEATFREPPTKPPEATAKRSATANRSARATRSDQPTRKRQPEAKHLSTKRVTNTSVMNP